MRKIREVLRLRWERNVSFRDISSACAIGRTTAQETVERARKAGLSWPLPEDLDDAKLEEMLYPSSEGAEGSMARALPDWATIHREYRRKGVTLNLLWQEYKAVHPDGYQ